MAMNLVDRKSLLAVLMFFRPSDSNVVLEHSQLPSAYHWYAIWQPSSATTKQAALCRQLYIPRVLRLGS